MKIEKQTRKQPFWIEEADNKVPVKELKKKELITEDVTFKIATEAFKIYTRLAAFKDEMKLLIAKAEEAIMSEYVGKKTVFKGNRTLYNFDRSIKVCVKVSQPIKFDELIILQAKRLLDEFLSDGLSAKNSFVKQMVLEAFETSRGQMDTKKVLGLKRYADRITDERYTRAMHYIDEAIRRPESAIYFQVWVRGVDGKYSAIILDIAKI